MRDPDQPDPQAPYEALPVSGAGHPQQAGAAAGAMLEVRLLPERHLHTEQGTSLVDHLKERVFDGKAETAVSKLASRIGHFIDDGCYKMIFIVSGWQFPAK